MSLNITGFIKSLLPSFSKSDLETDMEISLEAIDSILSSYSGLEEVLKVAKIEAKPNKDALKQFYKELHDFKPKAKLSNNGNIATDTLALFSNVKANGDYILREVSDAVNDVVVSQALTAYKANLLRAVAHYYFMTRFALDLANFLYVNEVENAGTDLPKESRLNPKQREFVTKNIWIYARMLSVYGSDASTFKDKLSSVEQITLPKDQIEEVVDAYSGDKVDVFNNLPAGFVGSPIYSIRLIFAEWEATRYQHLKNQKKLLELRLLHLKLMKESGQSDVNLEKEIMYLQKRVTDVDHSLSKIEEDVQ